MMNYKNIYTESENQLVESLASLWFPGRPKDQDYIRRLLTEEEPLLAEPVFQSMFPWEESNVTFEGLVEQNVLDGDFVSALSNVRCRRDDTERKAKEYEFPAKRHPYVHQEKSWKTLLNDKKSIVVTTGTGSGKTECFMVPVLQDLFRQKQAGVNDCIQAIFLYPLNALMKSQQNRIDAWCRSLAPNVNYAIYNGDMEKDDLPNNGNERYLPQIFTRPQMRRNPPQILFTNPTMLNYMLVRDEDQEMIQKSKGKLRWIILDEAHTYTGSAATELALQIKRVLTAFDTPLENVRFAITSATIGDAADTNAKNHLKGVMKALTGKDDIEIIGGKRILPPLESTKAEESINKINQDFGTSLSLANMEELRRKVNSCSSITLNDITACLDPSTPIERRLEFVDRISDKVDSLQEGNQSAAFIPTRMHLFVRTISGVYACSNGACPHSVNRPTELGYLTTHQHTYCPHCGSPMLEVATCSDCGGMFVIGEENTQTGCHLRVKEREINTSLFELDDDSDSSSDENAILSSSAGAIVFALGVEKNTPPRSEICVQHKRYDPNSHCFAICPEDDPNYHLTEFSSLTSDALCCPHCATGLSANKVLYFRASAEFQSRILAPVLLDNAEKADSITANTIREGRKYLVFTDGRQGTAKHAMTMNQDVESKWFRSAVYHCLSSKRREDVRFGGLTPQEEKDLEDSRKSYELFPLPYVLNRIHELEQKQKDYYIPSPEPIAWNDIEGAISRDSDLGKLFNHVENAKNNTSGKWSPDKYDNPTAYLQSLYIQEFCSSAKRAASLENLGFVHVEYPGLENVGSKQIGDFTLSEDDWRNFLKICVDFVMRYGRHYTIRNGAQQYDPNSRYTSIIYGHNSELNGVDKWPKVKMATPTTAKKSQSKLVQLLCYAMGIQSASDMTSQQIKTINGFLSEAWNVLCSRVFTKCDYTNDGYMLDMMDNDKVQICLTEKGWVCPVDHVVVDTLFMGVSPRIRGEITKENQERFKVTTSELTYPWFPYAFHQKKEVDGGLANCSHDEISIWINEAFDKQVNAGVFRQTARKIIENESIYLSGEHSAQQDDEVRIAYEKAFDNGTLNVLSCTTTLEMGVDISGVTEVVMNTIPPKPANYMQRAGRAGRRKETRALALSFCPNSPIGENIWKNPNWPMDHMADVPEVKFNSRQIVQRHVNSFLFAIFIQEHNGIKVSMKLKDFFDINPNTNSRMYDEFVSSLYKMSMNNGDTADSIKENYSHLVKGTGMEKTSFTDAITECCNNIAQIRNIYMDRIASFDAVLATTTDTNSRPYTILTSKKKNYKETLLIAYLAENMFLPSAGIPTGLVEFIPDSKVGNNRNTERTHPSNHPTLHLSHAISQYAPGNEIVKNEWCYKPEGINLKTAFNATNRNALQSCDKCGYTTIAFGSPFKDCPACHAKDSMHGVKTENGQMGNGNFTEIVEPAAFTVAYGSKPKRKRAPITKTNYVQPVLLNMVPWPPISKGVKIEIRESAPTSEILFYNRGGNGLGYALCPYCGRMQDETCMAGVANDDTPLAYHNHLETGGTCEGTQNNGINIRRNVLLVGRYQTDFVEIHFYDQNDQLIIDEETLFSLGVIISRRLSVVLGINDGEIDFGYNPAYHSIFIYDTALGGAGYSNLLRDNLTEVLNGAYDLLKGCNCKKSCVNCLIDKQSQWYINHLDRNKALTWLELERNSREAPQEVCQKWNDVVAVTSDLSSVMSNTLSNSNVDSVKLFVASDPSTWQPDDFSASAFCKLLSNNGRNFSFVFEKNPNLKSLEPADLATALNIAFKNTVEKYADKKDGYAPLMSVHHTDGRTLTYLAKGELFKMDKDWGKRQLFSTKQFDIKYYTLPSTELIKGIDTNKNIVMENYIKYDVTTDKFLESLTQYENDKWLKIRSELNGCQNIQVEYTDKYLRKPIGCYILFNLIRQLREYLNISISSVTLSLDYYAASNNGLEEEPDLDINYEFHSFENRECFLTKCSKALLGNTPNFDYSSISQHHRCLTLKTDKGTLTIRPDGGITWGWKTNVNVHKASAFVRNLGSNFDKPVSLYNNAKSSGILYTIAMKKK